MLTFHRLFELLKKDQKLKKKNSSLKNENFNEYIELAGCQDAVNSYLSNYPEYAELVNKFLNLKMDSHQFSNQFLRIYLINWQIVKKFLRRAKKYKI